MMRDMERKNTLRKHRVTFGDNEKGLPQRELSKRAGINLTRYWNLEKHYAVATPEEREALARELGVPESELFPEGSDDETREQSSAA